MCSNNNHLLLCFLKYVNNNYLLLGLVKYVNNNHSEGQCEATRVLGNLSRSRSVRDLLMQHEGS